MVDICTFQLPVANILSTYTVCEAYNANTAKSAFFTPYFCGFAERIYKHS